MRKNEVFKGLHCKSYSTNLFTGSYLPEVLRPTPRNSTRPQSKFIQCPDSKKQQLTNIELYFSKTNPNKPKCSAIVSMISRKQSSLGPKVTLESLLDNEFPVLEFKIRELIDFSKMILQTSQFCRINFPGKIVRRLVSLIADNYKSVAYHNFSHAFSLMMFNYQCLAKSFWLKYLYTQEEYFYILIAGLAHDINHPGTNNAYEIKSKTPLSQIYHQESVLENMHISHLWKMLSNHEALNFLDASKDKNKAKGIITRLILNTDMAFHNKNLEKLKLISRNCDFRKNKDVKWVLMEQIFHACDIGNSCGQFQNYMKWNALLACEFTEQVQLQELNGFEVTKMMIFRDATDVYRDQLFFIGYIVQPLWKQISQICPGLQHFTKAIDRNISKVKEELRKLQN